MKEQDFLFSHKVTGEELNDRMLVLKRHLYNINDTQIKLTKEFGQVYNALEALDKDYIQAILISVKATEKTSEGVKAAQENIEKLVNDQIRTLEILKKFKQKLDGYSHLEDVDKIWSDCQNWHLEITKFANELSLAAEQSGENSKAVAELESTVKILEERTNDLSKQLISMSDGVEAAKAYINILNEIAHLKDVDDMWTAVGNCSTQIDYLKEQYDSIADSIRKNKDDIDEFWKQNEDYQMRLNRVEQESKGCADKLKSVSHLDDVDVMWNDAKEHKIMLDKCEKRSEELTNAIQKNKEENESITEAVQTTNEAIEDLIKKVKIAYWIAGGSAGLAVIELILLLMRVL